MDDIEKEIIELDTLEKKSLLNKVLSIVLPLILGVAIVYYLVKDTNFNELLDVLKTADWRILIISLFFGLAANTIKAYRWRLFIRPLGYEPRLRNLIFTTWGSFAVNFLIPRAGEVWKSGALTKQEKIPLTKTLGSMIVDRLFDTMIVIIICLVAFFINMNFFLEEISKNEKLLDQISKLINSPILYISIFAFMAIIYIIFKFFGRNKVVKKLKDMIKDICNDLKSIWKMKDKVWIAIYTLIAWTLYFCYFYITFYAFDFTKDLGIMAGLIVFAMSSLSMVIPTQGGLGPWQVAVIAALGLYGVDKLEATAFATGVFSLQSLWIISWGVIGIICLSVENKNKSKK